VRALIVAVLAAALAGCGSSSTDRGSSVPAPAPPSQASAPPVAPNRLAPPCAHRARAAIPGGVSAATPFTARSGAAGCRLEGPELSAIVLLDSAPQAYYRLEREVVEFGQNVDWTKVPPAAYPRTVRHLGLDANWFPLQSRLLTTDGVRLITIKVHGASIGPSERRRIAVDLARVYLGPLRKPAGY
jgi:hypothetical protein